MVEFVPHNTTRHYTDSETVPFAKSVKKVCCLWYCSGNIERDAKFLKSNTGKCL